jgi:hypothetical protein
MAHISPEPILFAYLEGTDGNLPFQEVPHIGRVQKRPLCAVKSRARWLT